MAHGLPRKIRIAFIVQMAMASLAILLAFYVVALLFKYSFVQATLQEEARHYWSLYEASPAQPPPNTHVVRGYLVERGYSTLNLPPALRGLGPGFHELDAEGQMVWVDQREAGTLYLVFLRDQAMRTAVWFAVIPAVAALLTIYGATWLTYRASSRLVSPVAWLARHVSRWDPRQPDVAALAPDRLPADIQGEARQLARALHALGQRVEAHVARERDFTRDASHELRTPLTVVHGYLDMLDPEDHPEWAPALAEMRRQSQRMARLVEGLLTLSRLESRDSLPEEPVEMAPLLASLAREAAALGQGRHAVEVRDEAGCDLLGSPQDLHSAFSNLVANAVRYTPAGGTVRIVFAREDGGGAALSVEDTGPGIPAEHIPRLTERFYRVSASRSRESGGTGLGLSIVKHVLGLHQARLSIDSRVGHGSRFTCHFGPERVRMRHDGPVAARAAP